MAGAEALKAILGKRQSEKSGRGWFVFAMVTFIVALVVFGFSFTFMANVVDRLRPLILYIHVASAGLWLALLLLQVWLIRRGKVALHRRLGSWGVWLGLIVTVSAIATTVVLRQEAIARHPGNLDEIAFLAVPLPGVILFSLYFALGVRASRVPAHHRRYMLLAAAILPSPALARVPGADQIMLSDLTAASLVAIICAHDWFTDRRVHPINLVGLALYIVLPQITQRYLFEQQPEWWMAFARAVTGS